MPRITPLFSLKNKVAIITGSSKGIGEAMARGLAEFGAKVVISSRNQEAVDAVAQQFREDGLEATGIACHVGKEEQLEALVERTMEVYGRIDILVNNAAVNPFWGPVEQVEKPLFDKIMSTNTWAPLALSQRVFPHMQQQGGGSIINISSVEGLRATFGLSAYSTSKAALLMVSSNLAKEWGPHNIRVNTVCPGLVKTKLSQALWSNEAVLKQYEGAVPLQRMAMPDELAGIAVFLASDAASYITGGVFSVDGGYMQA